MRPAEKRPHALLFVLGGSTKARLGPASAQIQDAKLTRAGKRTFRYWRAQLILAGGSCCAESACFNVIPCHTHTDDSAINAPQVSFTVRWIDDEGGGGGLFYRLEASTSASSKTCPAQGGIYTGYRYAYYEFTCEDGTPFR